MSSDSLRSSHQSQPTPASTTSEEAPRSPRAFARLRHRLETYRADGFKCVYCGKDLLADSDWLVLATVDHIIPRSPELVALRAAAARWDSRTLASQALQLVLLTRQRGRDLARLASSLKHWADALQDLRSEPLATGVEPRGRLWQWLQRLVG